MKEATVSDNEMNGETFFSLLNGRLGESAMKIVAAAFAETMGRGGLAYVRSKTGLSSTKLKAAIRELRDQS